MTKAERERLGVLLRKFSETSDADGMRDLIGQLIHRLEEGGQ